MSLDSLPLEILEEILQYLLFPVNFSGVYFEPDDDCQWFQTDALNLAICCKKLRNVVIPVMWENVQVKLAMYIMKEPECCYRLLSNERGTFKNSRFLLNCSLNTHSPGFSSAQPTGFLSRLGWTSNPSTIPVRSIFPSKSNQPFDSALSYIRRFKIDSYSVEKANINDTGNRNKALQNYQALLRLINPTIMPRLEDLELDIMFAPELSKVNTELGRNLELYERKIKLKLTAVDLLSMESIEASGLYPYITELVLKQDWTKSESEIRILTKSITPTNFNLEDKLPELQSLTLENFHVHPLTTPISAQFSTIYFTITPFTNISYLDISKVRQVAPTSAWFPPSVTSLKCNTSFEFGRLNTDEATLFERFKNVQTVTLEMLFADSPSKTYFSNLKELFVYKQDIGTLYGLTIPSFVIVVDILKKNQKTLNSFGIDFFYLDDFSKMEPYFSNLKRLEFEKVPYNLSQGDVSGSPLFYRTLKACGPELTQLRFPIGQVQIDRSRVNRLANNMRYSECWQAATWFRYPEFRKAILQDCPNLKFIISAQYKYDSIYMDDKPCQADKYFKDFDQSEDSKHFKLDDFFYKVSSKKFLLLGESYKSYQRRFVNPKANQCMLDLDKLRTLIEHYNLA